MYYSAEMNRHRQNGLSFVPKKIRTWVPREARVGLEAIAVKRLTAILSLYPHKFLLLSVSFEPEYCFSLQAMLETMSSHRHCGPKPG